MIITPATTLVIEAPQDDAQRLRRYIDTEWRHFPAYAGKKTSRIQLLTVGHIDGVDSPEGYRLSVTPDATTIEATSGAGLFYGLQTLIQLADGTDTITAVDITATLSRQKIHIKTDRCSRTTENQPSALASH